MKNSAATLLLALLCVAMNAQMPTDGLRAYWPFSGSPDDMVGINDGIIVGNVLPAADRFGEDGCAYAFDGSQSAMLLVQGMEDFDVSPDSVMSISLWFQGGSDEAGDFEVLFLKYGFGFNPLANPNYALSLYDLNKILMQADFQSLWLDDDILPFPADDQWHHVVGVFIPGHWKMYLDNVLVNEFISEEALIGQWSSDIVMGVGFEGVLDDVAFYQSALSEEEIGELFVMGSSCTVNIVDILRPENLLIYPNPANDYLTIESKDLSADYVQVYSVTGDLVMEENVTSNMHSIDITALESGIYMVSLTQMGNSVYQGKLVVKH